MGIQVGKNEGPCPFPKRDNNEIAKKNNEQKIYLFQNNGANFNKTCHRATLGDGNSSLLKLKALSFFKGR